MAHQEPGGFPACVFPGQEIPQPRHEIELACPGLEEIAVSNNNNTRRQSMARDGHTQIRPNACGLSRGDRDQGRA